MSIRSEDVLTFIKKEASKYPQIKKIVLFGSRARKEERLASDYDLAIYQQEDFDDAKFQLDCIDNKPTLCKLDFVTISSSLSAELLKRIETEGIEIYP